MCNKISFLAVTPNLSILGHMLLRKLYINVVIANVLLYLKSFYGVPEPKYLEFSKFYAAMTKKISFLAISSKLTILGHMLLHKL